ncbi:MAG TPA: M1 family metallopeptidase [Flavobacteriales bacterium]|nr:M1 family metallopeptidase [Flavobacteriales bacterium]
MRQLIPAAVLVMAGPSFDTHAQCDRWQQRVAYTMSVDLDHRTHRFTGASLLKYTNNSPDTLQTVFFHLYLNAFKPGSEMDVRSRTIADPDPRVGSRIAALTPDQVGDLQVVDLKQEGRSAVLTPMGTVLKVDLPKPLLPGRSTVLTYNFTGQVPVQIRRTGRDNAEGVAYSMSQWYPKLAEYDHRGWHAYPYVGREFHGVWGDFDVTLTLDSAYTVAATGVLQNPEQVGHGYPSRKPIKRPSGDRLTWRFVAKDVHDFAWGADRDFKHVVLPMADGPELHFFYKDQPELEAVWKELPTYMERCFRYMNEHFGKYPWPQYSFVQGGDGGMEYPMLTLITGKRRLGSLVGVSVHECVHSWYYGVLASNEGRFAWMDEGFTEYAGSQVMELLFPRGEDPHAGSIAAYRELVESGRHEAPSIHADHFLTNRTYGTTAYSFGEMFVHQLGAVVGEKTLAAGLKRYYATCGFKHPEPIDFERVMEKQSGVELDWYFDQWVNTTRTLDYAITEMLQVGDSLRITLARKGDQCMPVDLELPEKDGRSMLYHVPLSLMRGARPADGDRQPFTTLPAWQWTNPTYQFTVPGRLADLTSIMLDPYRRTADMDLTNDRVYLGGGVGGMVRP